MVNAKRYSKDKKTAADKAEMKRLFKEYSENPSKEKRDLLIEKNLYIAEILAKKYANRGIDFDDIYQVASIGLIYAIERYDIEKGFEFSSFATPTIIGEIKKHFRDKGWTIRVPRRIQELSKKINNAKVFLSQELQKVSAIIPLYKHNPEGYLVMATREGTVKKTELAQFENIRKTGIIGISLRDEDELISVQLTDGGEDLIIVTQKGMAIRFNEDDVREMGRTAMGVKGVSLKKEDMVVSMEIVEKDKFLLVISEKGFGKRTSLDEYKTQNRGGKGLITYSIKEKTGDIVSARVVSEQDEVMIISLNGTIIRLGIKDISIMGRSTQGVTLMRMKDDRVVAVAQYIGE